MDAVRKSPGWVACTKQLSRYTFLVTVATVLLGLFSTTAQADSREQAKRIHDRLAGVPPTLLAPTPFKSATLTSLAVSMAALASLGLRTSFVFSVYFTK